VRKFIFLCLIFAACSSTPKATTVAHTDARTVTRITRYEPSSGKVIEKETTTTEAKTNTTEKVSEVPTKVERWGVWLLISAFLLSALLFSLAMWWRKK